LVLRRPGLGHLGGCPRPPEAPQLANGRSRKVPWGAGTEEDATSAAFEARPLNPIGMLRPSCRWEPTPLRHFYADPDSHPQPSVFVASGTTTSLISDCEPRLSRAGPFPGSAVAEEDATTPGLTRPLGRGRDAAASTAHGMPRQTRRKAGDSFSGASAAPPGLRRAVRGHGLRMMAAAGGDGTARDRKQATSRS
jgi:hypothetical protein